VAALGTTIYESPTKFCGFHGGARWSFAEILGEQAGVSQRVQMVRPEDFHDQTVSREATEEVPGNPEGCDGMALPPRGGTINTIRRLAILLAVSPSHPRVLRTPIALRSYPGVRPRLNISPRVRRTLGCGAGQAVKQCPQTDPELAGRAKSLRRASMPD
jgi:hypothetical protein